MLTGVLQTKYTATLREHTNTMTHMQRELESLRASEKSLRTKLRDMELDNDDLEKSERSDHPSAIRRLASSVLIFRRVRRKQREGLVPPGLRVALRQEPRADRPTRGGTRQQGPVGGGGPAPARRASRSVRPEPLSRDAPAN